MENVQKEAVIRQPSDDRTRDVADDRTRDRTDDRTKDLTDHRIEPNHTIGKSMQQD